jgi:hypothetical protein
MADDPDLDEKELERFEEEYERVREAARRVRGEKLIEL